MSMANSVPGRIVSISLTIFIITAVYTVKEKDFDKFKPLFNYRNVKKWFCFSECTTLQYVYVYSLTWSQRFHCVSNLLTASHQGSTSFFIVYYKHVCACIDKFYLLHTLRRLKFQTTTGEDNK